MLESCIVFKSTHGNLYSSRFPPLTWQTAGDQRRSASIIIVQYIASFWGSFSNTFWKSPLMNRESKMMNFSEKLRQKWRTNNLDQGYWSSAVNDINRNLWLKCEKRQITKDKDLQWITSTNIQHFHGTKVSFWRTHDQQKFSYCQDGFQDVRPSIKMPC